MHRLAQFAIAALIIGSTAHAQTMWDINAQIQGQYDRTWNRPYYYATPVYYAPVYRSYGYSTGYRPYSATPSWGEFETNQRLQGIQWELQRANNWRELGW
jgi:hypothetical protein